jgi:AcrR family transcriptional regulator
MIAETVQYRIRRASNVREREKTMPPRGDRRVRRTRAALQDALLGLMGEKAYEAISVQDIIDRADVGRSTFYSHYTDKKDLFDDGFGDLRALFEVPVAAQEAGAWHFMFSAPFLQHVEHQRAIARVLFDADGGSPLINEIEKLVAGAVRRELEDLPAPPSVPPEALVRFLAGAFLQLLEWWLTTEPPATAVEVERIFQRLAGAAVRG